MFDCHSHSDSSHDCKIPVAEMLAAAAGRVDGYAVTDHFDNKENAENAPFDHIVRSYREFSKAAENAPVKMLFGVEIGEYIWNPGHAEELIALLPFDVILGSVHCVRFGEVREAFSRIDFSVYDEEMISAYMDAYYRDLLETVRDCDVDVCCHINNPVKYLTQKTGKIPDVSRWDERIDEILETLIGREIALEVNTACTDRLQRDFMPEERYLTRYRQLGGRLVTVGSDAHVPARFGLNLDKAAQALRRAGFTSAYYYEKRKPVEYSL